MKKNNLKNLRKEKILLAMSGGIDSSFSVHLLRQQGYEVIGVYLNNLKSDASKNNWLNVKKIADYLQVPLHRLKSSGNFSKRVIKPFVEDYARGLTPNPCILCNRVFKFKELMDLADKLKIKKVATGHYALLKKQGNYVYLSPANDEKKDQVYFLYQLPQAYLKRLIFPLGKFAKIEVKELAKDVLPPGLLPVGESQEICFVPADDLNTFLKQSIKKRKGGEIIEAGSNNVLGKYDNHQFFTIGQRKGLGLGGGPWYVSKIDANKNRVYVVNESDKQVLEPKELRFTKILWAGAVPKLPVKIKYKLRSAQKWANGVLKKDKKHFVLSLQKGQLPPSPGQSAVFLAGGKIIGGQVVGS
ncbi:MAG TPA: tRNA 2-thiouridine(34) synthase MnmA [bacterium]|nr:tRNA 2-thiouridine(34) synthase MnmA [bacterium]